MAAAPADEMAQLQTQVQRLREQLQEEQLLRRQAEEAVEAVAADRNRLQVCGVMRGTSAAVSCLPGSVLHLSRRRHSSQLRAEDTCRCSSPPPRPAQRARDELAAALLAAERRAQEAEEEAAALHRQLQAAGAPATASGESTPPRPSSAQQQQAQQQQDTSPGSAARAAEEAADAEVLLAALDEERRRSEELARLLEAAEREAVAATERLLKAQARIEALRAKARGRKPPPGTAAAAEAGEEEELEALQARIAALKAARDKLIAAFDAQAAEVERLSGDNAALAEVRALCVCGCMLRLRLLGGLCFLRGSHGCAGACCPWCCARACSVRLPHAPPSGGARLPAGRLRGGGGWSAPPTWLQRP